MCPRASAPDKGLPFQVDKETNTEEAEDTSLAVRPKERGGRSARQRPLVRSSVIVRSQTFSPGERVQYVCRVRTACPPATRLGHRGQCAPAVEMLL